MFRPGNGMRSLTPAEATVARRLARLMHPTISNDARFTTYLGFRKSRAMGSHRSVSKWPPNRIGRIRRHRRILSMKQKLRGTSAFARGDREAIGREHLGRPHAPCRLTGSTDPGRPRNQRPDRSTGRDASQGAGFHATFRSAPHYVGQCGPIDLVATCPRQLEYVPKRIWRLPTKRT
jgi:hypothetical protein